MQCDFANSAKPGVLENVYQQVADLDVSILVNNVGCSYPLPLVKLTMDRL